MTDFQLYGQDAGVDAVVYVDGNMYYLADNGEQRKAVPSRHDEFELEVEHPEYVIDTDE